MQERSARTCRWPDLGSGRRAELLEVNPTTLASRLRALKIKTNTTR